MGKRLIIGCLADDFTGAGDAASFIAKSGMTQAAFSIKFCIPLRTIEDWATDKRKCADYIRLMVSKEFGFIPKLGGN